MKNIAIFASGDGSNAEAIAKYFKNSDIACVKIVLSNRQKAGVHDRIKALGIPTLTFSKDEWKDCSKILSTLQKNDIDLIVLAGFLCMIETPLINAFKARIINIHPSLLPKYGGPGMWGHHVHDAVISAGEKESGITIHYVTEEVDGGEIIFQDSCPVKPDDTAETLASRIHSLEHAQYPNVIEQLLR
ncbi:MAG: phosphoribosylglycinamide formyltransferase [Muribaculaceae bacterium]|nr:phosphoribosylglycinamide formyltransferase [Muribaculaceae bacterium]